MPELWRTSGGAVLHRPDCPALARATRNPHEWKWARDKSRDEITRAAKEQRIEPCARCRPLQIRV